MLVTLATPQELPHALADTAKLELAANPAGVAADGSLTLAAYWQIVGWMRHVEARLTRIESERNDTSA